MKENFSVWNEAVGMYQLEYDADERTLSDANTTITNVSREEAISIMEEVGAIQ